MKKITILLMGLGVMTLGFTGCKKGEDDPFLSLKNRYARLKGDWKLVNVEGTGSYSDEDGTSSSTYSYSDGKLIITNSDGENDTLMYKMNLKFEKDDKMTFTQRNDYEGGYFEEYSEVGGYAFLGKNKNMELKNKEVLAMIGQSYTFTDLDGTESGTISSSDYTIWFTLVRLTNKEMKFKWKYNLDYASNFPDNPTMNEAFKSMDELIFTLEKE